MTAQESLESELECVFVKAKQTSQRSDGKEAGVENRKITL